MKQITLHSLFSSALLLLVVIIPAQMARKKQMNIRKASEVTNNLPDHGDGFKVPVTGRPPGKISSIPSFLTKERFVKILPRAPTIKRHKRRVSRVGTSNDNFSFFVLRCFRNFDDRADEMFFRFRIVPKTRLDYVLAIVF